MSVNGEQQLQRDDLLTDDEHRAIELAGELWNQLCKVVGGSNRDNDLRELVPHVHAIQQAVMSNAAARAFPELYRRLGSSFVGEVRR